MVSGIEFECWSRDVLLVRNCSGRDGDGELVRLPASAADYTHSVNIHNSLPRHTR